MTNQLTMSRTAWVADERRRHGWTTRLLENRSFRLEQIDQLTVELASGGTAARQQVAAAMLAAAQLSLQHTHDALGRLAAGTFGTCGTCSRPIELERLDVLPMAASCTTCQYQADHEPPAVIPVGLPEFGDDD